MDVSVGVCVGVDVPIGVRVGVGVLAGVRVGVGVRVAVGATVGVEVAELPNSMKSRGALALSRLSKVFDVVLVVVSAKLHRPSPVISGVTSTFVHVPAAICPDNLATPPIAGALA